MLFYFDLIFNDILKFFEVLFNKITSPTVQNILKFCHTFIYHTLDIFKIKNSFSYPRWHCFFFLQERYKDYIEGHLSSAAQRVHYYFMQNYAVYWPEGGAASQPVQRAYWPENVIDWLGKWRPTCVMRYACGHKLQRFRLKISFWSHRYSVPRVFIPPRKYEDWTPWPRGGMKTLGTRLRCSHHQIAKFPFFHDMVGTRRNTARDTSRKEPLKSSKILKFG